MKILLDAHTPFLLSTVIHSHGWIQLIPFTKDDPSGSFTYIDRLDSGRVVDLIIREANGGASVEINGSLSQTEQDEITRKVKWMLGLDQDFSAFYALARSEPKLAHVEHKAQGRVLRCPTLFEDVIKTILTTNTLWAHTIRMAGALVSQFGDPLPADPSQHAFPTPNQLAATDEQTLRSKARLGYRAPYVLGLARLVSSGTLDLEAFKTKGLPTAQLRKYLLAIKGVGGYAAANLLMLLGRYDFVPVDSWALKMVSHEWYNNEPIEQAQVEAVFERWGEGKGLAYWFWDWTSLNS
jgi:3-methyladenine DNA glycosylase/8-oxoguanine DNA glycosylase